jgi:hypothetical protein
MKNLFLPPDRVICYLFSDALDLGLPFLVVPTLSKALPQPIAGVAIDLCRRCLCAGGNRPGRALPISGLESVARRSFRFIFCSRDSVLAVFSVTAAESEVPAFCSCVRVCSVCAKSDFARVFFLWTFFSSLVACVRGKLVSVASLVFCGGEYRLRSGSAARFVLRGGSPSWLRGSSVAQIWGLLVLLLLRFLCLFSCAWFRSADSFCSLNQTVFRSRGCSQDPVQISLFRSSSFFVAMCVCESWLPLSWVACATGFVRLFLPDARSGVLWFLTTVCMVRLVCSRICCQDPSESSWWIYKSTGSFCFSHRFEGFVFVFTLTKFSEGQYFFNNYVILTKLKKMHIRFDLWYMSSFSEEFLPPPPPSGRLFSPSFFSTSTCIRETWSYMF